MIFHAPLEHPETVRPVNPNINLMGRIISPWVVEVSHDCFRSKGHEYDATAKVFSDGEIGDLHVRRLGDRPYSKKQDTVDQAALDEWALTVRINADAALAMLTDPAYLARAEPIRAMVRAHLEEAVRKLKHEVGQMRMRCADQWLELGTSSTATLGNHETQCAKAQAVLAAKVEAFDAAFAPFCSARTIAGELMGGPSFADDTTGKPFHFSLYV